MPSRVIIFTLFIKLQTGYNLNVTHRQMDKLIVVHTYKEQISYVLELYMKREQFQWHMKKLSHMMIMFYIITEMVIICMYTY